MRMSAMLGDGYKLIAAAVDKPIPRGRYQAVDDVGFHRLRAAHQHITPKLPIRANRGEPLVGGERTSEDWNVKLHYR